MFDGFPLLDGFSRRLTCMKMVELDGGYRTDRTATRDIKKPTQHCHSCCALSRRTGHLNGMFRNTLMAPSNGTHWLRVLLASFLNSEFVRSHSFTKYFYTALVVSQTPVAAVFKNVVLCKTSKMFAILVESRSDLNTASVALYLWPHLMELIGDLESCLPRSLTAVRILLPTPPLVKPFFKNLPCLL